ncbi:MAG: hypothetical protein QOE75_2054, partial [Solirubrobacterales bacterium]|nr:hypothetical protein [Solirubrobacterales bacterium]
MATTLAFFWELRSPARVAPCLNARKAQP